MALITLINRNTQRMLLKGGSRMFEGSKLKSKSTKSFKATFEKNLIEIDNQSKVFKISSFEQNQALSKTFTPFKKLFNQKDRKAAIYSEGVSPRQKSTIQMRRATSAFNQREPFKLSTKQLFFKMKKIKRVQSEIQANGIYSNKNKISKIVNWKGQLYERSSQQDRPLSNSSKREQQQKQKRPTQSFSTSKWKKSNDQDETKYNLKINCLVKNKLDKNDRNQKLRMGYLSPKQNIDHNSIKAIKKPSVDRRVKIELHIAQKLFHLQKNNIKNSIF